MILIEFNVKTSADFKKARIPAWKSSPYQERDRLRLFVLEMNRKAYSWHTKCEKCEWHSKWICPSVRPLPPYDEP